MLGGLRLPTGVSCICACTKKRPGERRLNRAPVMTVSTATGTWRLGHGRAEYLPAASSRQITNNLQS